jgi:peptidoglycan LD-endopeptidase CwlK
MPHFGRRSRRHLATCDERLQRILNDVIERVDCAVICGTRGKAAQDKAYREGASTVQWPNSRHNASPSTAVDVVPWPLSWDVSDPAVRDTWDVLALEIKGTANRLGIPIEWGGDWRRFKDLPHWQLPR